MYYSKKNEKKKKLHCSVNGLYIGALLRMSLRIFHAQKTREGREGHIVGIGTLFGRNGCSSSLEGNGLVFFLFFSSAGCPSIPTSQTNCPDQRTPPVQDTVRIIRPGDLKTL